MKGKLTVTEKDGAVDWEDIAITIDGESCTLKQVFDAWKAEREKSVELLAALKDITAVVRESEGVAGYHLNGNVAKWGELEAFAKLDDLIAKAEVREDA